MIHAQGEDSKKVQLIYLTWKGSFQVNLYKMIRFLSGKLKKHMKLAKIVKISEIFNRLVFPLNFNRFCHPITFTHKLSCWYASVREILDSPLKSELPLFTFVGIKYIYWSINILRRSITSNNQYLSNTEFSSFLKTTFYVRHIWQISLLWETRMLHRAHQLRLPVKCWVQQPRHICVTFQWRCHHSVNIYDDIHLVVEVQWFPVYMLSYSVADPGFPRGERQPRKGGRQHTICAKLTENCTPKKIRHWTGGIR